VGVSVSVFSQIDTPYRRPGIVTANFVKRRGADVPARKVHEPTGSYHADFERRFSTRFATCKVSPLQARRFAQLTGTSAKTDKGIARLMAQMGVVAAQETDVPLPKSQRNLRELQIARMILVKDETRLKNRLQTLTAILCIMPPLPQRS